MLYGIRKDEYHTFRTVFFNDLLSGVIRQMQPVKVLPDRVLNGIFAVQVPFS